jgi:hypothetical protein
MERMVTCVPILSAFCCVLASGFRTACSHTAAPSCPLSIMGFGLTSSMVAEFAARTFVRAALNNPSQPTSVLSFYLVSRVYMIFLVHSSMMVSG